MSAAIGFPPCCVPLPRTRWSPELAAVVQGRAVRLVHGGLSLDGWIVGGERFCRPRLVSSERVGDLETRLLVGFAMGDLSGSHARAGRTLVRTLADARRNFCGGASRRDVAG